MPTPHQRLQTARKRAGFETAADAARALGVHPATYTSHENGIRGFRTQQAEHYARRFGVALEWLLTGNDIALHSVHAQLTVPIIGAINSGGEFAAYLDRPRSQLETVQAPPGAAPETVAAEIRPNALSSLFDNWMLFYDDVKTPVTPTMVGRLCIIQIDDGRVLVRRLRTSSRRGTYHLISHLDATMFDQTLTWASPVRTLIPRR